MSEPEWDWEQTIHELRARYGALELADLNECMTMLLASAAQVAHRTNEHPSAILYTFAEQVKELWGERWGMFVHDMLEADDP